MEAIIEISKGLNGNVKVTVEHKGHTISNVWKMTVAQAQAEAEEIAHRMGWKVA
jgi:hypothetical protein